MNNERRGFLKTGGALIAISLGVGTTLLQACGGGDADTDADADAHRTPAQRALLSHLRLVTSGRMREWVALFASDGVLEFPYAPAGVPPRLAGHDELLGYMLHFPETFDVKFVDLAFHEMTDPNVAVAEFRLTGRAIQTGKPYEQVCISVVFTDAQGRITLYRDHWNPLVAIEALSATAS